MLITKNGITLNVSKGAYNASFKAQGWVEDKDGQETVKNNPTQMAPQPETSENSELSLDKEPEEDADAKIDDLSTEKDSTNTLVTDEEKDAEAAENVAENTVETPISEMTVNELIEYADEHNIDISGLQGKAKIRAAIEASMK